MEVFDRGSLSQALRASMSVPGLFAPIEINHRLYVDGGLVRNLPVDVMRSMGVDLIIAVNLGTPPLKREQLATVVGVAGQMIAILTEQNVQRSLKELDPQRDLLIVPDLGDISAGDFKRADEAITIGVAAARGAAWLDVEIPVVAHLAALPPERHPGRSGAGTGGRGGLLADRPHPAPRPEQIRTIGPA